MYSWILHLINVLLVDRLQRYRRAAVEQASEAESFLSHQSVCSLFLLLKSGPDSLSVDF